MSTINVTGMMMFLYSVSIGKASSGLTVNLVPFLKKLCSIAALQDNRRIDVLVMRLSIGDRSTEQLFDAPRTLRSWDCGTKERQNVIKSSVFVNCAFKLRNACINGK